MFRGSPRGREFVPSLYVRVYHVPGLSEGQGVRSLIICEGVSLSAIPNHFAITFPHYMRIICEGVSQ